MVRAAIPPGPEVRAAPDQERLPDDVRSGATLASSVLLRKSYQNFEDMRT
jgi:hypothetical protein